MDALAGKEGSKLLHLLVEFTFVFRPVVKKVLHRSTDNQYAKHGDTTKITITRRRASHCGKPFPLKHDMEPLLTIAIKVAIIRGTRIALACIMPPEITTKTVMIMIT